MGEHAASPDRVLTIEPSPGSWRVGKFADAAALEFRASLGLPTDRPIVMTGHQAEFWHAGILAKLLAAEVFARSIGAAVAWFVVDQDDNDAGAVRYPAKGREGRIERALWRAGARAADGIATGSQPPLPADAPVSAEPALPCVADGLWRIRDAVRGAKGEASAARQITRANLSLFSSHLAPAVVVYASDLGATDAFARFVQRLGNESSESCEAYNRAAKAHPRARIRPLRHDALRGWELPLWRLAFGRTRQAVYARELQGEDIRSLAPRALLATGLMRLAACDLFIHGIGGTKYDQATDAWLQAWLGERPGARSTMVTATVRLPFQTGDTVDPASVSAARMLVHRARHHPALLGDAAAQREKESLLSAMASVPRKSSARAALYRQMHERLAESRHRHESRLSALRADASAQAARLAEARIIYDRTWSAPLHPPETIDHLANDVRRAFEGA